ncbi:MAG: hypothetical protein ACQEXQ_07620 [Bacillota bacterium]
MKNAYKLFQLEQCKHEERIAALNEELTLAAVELQELQREREAVLRNVTGNGDVTIIESNLEAATRRHNALQERIRYAEESKLQQLSAMLNDVEAWRLRSVAKKEDEYKAAIREHNRRKIEFLQSAKRIGELANDVDAINTESNEHRRAAGAPELRHWPFRHQHTIDANPSINGYEDASWKALAASEWLIREALLNGRLPLWSKEVMTNEHGE